MSEIEYVFVCRSLESVHSFLEFLGCDWSPVEPVLKWLCYGTAGQAPILRPSLVSAGQASIFRASVSCE